MHVIRHNRGADWSLIEIPDFKFWRNFPWNCFQDFWTILCSFFPLSLSRWKWRKRLFNLFKLTVTLKVWRKRGREGGRQLSSNGKTSNGILISGCPPVWPYWAIYCTLGNFTKSVPAIHLPKSPTFLGNVCKGVKIINFSSEIIFGRLL